MSLPAAFSSGVRSRRHGHIDLKQFAGWRKLLMTHSDAMPVAMTLVREAYTQPYQTRGNRALVAVTSTPVPVAIPRWGDVSARPAPTENS